MLLLLDQNVPVGTRELLSDHDVRTAYRMGWAELSNGDLLAAAEAAGFEILISCDQNLSYQQNLTGRRLSNLVLDTNRWAIIRIRGTEIERALSNMAAGSFVRLLLSSQR